MDDATLCVHKPAVSTAGYASLAVATHRASTIVFPDAASYASRLERGPDGYTYGLHGTPTVRTLEAQLAALEGATRAMVTPSGLSAATLVFLAVLRPGDRVLLPDAVYPPVREFADRCLRALGIERTYYDPLDAEGVGSLIGDDVRLIWVESPGSTTMELQDVPAIAAAARSRGVLVACDNTWATPLLFKPLDHGVDIVVEAVSKFIGGHSDLLQGLVAARDENLFLRLRDMFKLLGLGVSPDECSLALRGLETLAVRLAHAGRVGESLARWLADRPGVGKVLHPALPSCPGHRVWARDFKGASGVFSLTLSPHSVPRLDLALSQLRIFAIGASWGGTHSLIAPMDVRANRTVRPWPFEGPVIRFSIGLESEADLRDDLTRFTAALVGD